MPYYEVTLQVDPPLASQVEQHMRQEHIPAIFATGCFHQIRFCQASPARFRTSYEAASQANLDRYLRDHAPVLRAEFQRRFPQGVTLTRETWVEQERWG
jgi:Domain of unknown function (DUF4286)